MKQFFMDGDLKYRMMNSSQGSSLVLIYLGKIALFDCFFYRLSFLITAVAIRATGSDGITSDKFTHAACFAHGVVEMA